MMVNFMCQLDLAKRCPHSRWNVISGCFCEGWRKKWQPTPGFLPGKFHGQRSLADYSPRGCKESDMTEHACWEGMSRRFEQAAWVKRSLSQRGWALSNLLRAPTEQKKKKKKNLRKGKFSFFLSWVLPPLRPQTSALLVRRPSHSDGDLPIGFSNSQAFRPGLSLHCLLSWTSSLLIACQETSQPLYSCKSILMDSFLCVCICPIGCVSLEKPNTDIPKLRKCTPLQYSCLENPMDRVACVHGVAKSWTRLSNFT